jgi:DUF1680 family protein
MQSLKLRQKPDEIEDSAMASDTKGIDRRRFSLGLAMTPLALVNPQLLDAQEAAEKPHSAQTDKSTPPQPEPKKRWQIYEEEHFAHPLVFERRDVNPRVHPFALHDVILADDGPYAQSRAWSRGFMLRIAPDRLLHNFRLTAGLPSTAVPLGGLEKPDSLLRGHWVGHYLSGCALLYGSTGDAEAKARGDAIVEGIAECQAKLAAGGYVSAFPETEFGRLEMGQKVWAPFYTLHKLMAGLLDMHQHAGNAQALEVATKMADWVDGWTAARSEDRMQGILNEEFGGIAESLYNLAAITGDDRWAHAGDRFHKMVFLRPLLERRDELRQLHANTHIPQVIAAARRYELTGDSRFRVIPEFFWETVVESRTFAPGGSGTMERWVTHANHLAWEMKSSSENQECCCAYNMMKLTRQMFTWNPQIRHVEYYERNLLNHRLGTIEPKTGHTTYFLSMAPGAWKTLGTEDQTFWCCNGTALEEFAKLQNSIYFHDADSLYVNLFVASELHWRDRGVRLKQETIFPKEPRTRLTILDASKEKWTMRLRIPAWTTSEARITVNDHPLDIQPEPGTYVNLARVWNAGDRVELEMPMRLTRAVLGDDPSMQAFLYGPVVLAGQFPLGELSFALLHHNEEPKVKEAPLAVPMLAQKGGKLEEWIFPVTGEVMTFRTVGTGGEQITLKPLNESWQRFAVYFQVTS